MSSTLRDVVIESDRLRLLPNLELYAEALFSEFTADITTFMFPAPPKAIDETLEFIRAACVGLEAGSELQVVILSKVDGSFLGTCGLHRIDTATPELGIWIKRSAHGHGYGREAVTALCWWALDNLEFDYLIYPVDRRNVASRRIPESLGGYVGAEYEKINGSGNRLDLLEYRLEPQTLVETRASAAGRVRDNG